MLIKYKINPTLFHSKCGYSCFTLKKKRPYLFIFREGGREGERGGKHQSVASCTSPNGDLAHNPGMSPDMESN